MEDDQAKPFSHLFNGNPAMQIIWEETLRRISEKEQLAPVQLQIAKEWLTLARREELRLTALLELESQARHIENYSSYEGRSELVDLRRTISSIEQALDA